MPPVARSMNSPAIVEAHEPLAARIARAIVAVSAASLSSQVIDKVKWCLADLIGCAFESRDLPWSRQAVQIAEALNRKAGGATTIGAPGSTTCCDAAFANAVMGHGLVREDMHAGSISHLGIVVLPTLLALAQYRRVSGRDFIAAAVVGYAAQRMVAESPNLVVATGAYLSSFTLAVTEVTERAQLPVVTFSYSDLITSRGFKYVFQTSATGVQQAEGSLPALLELAEKASGQRPKTIGIVMDNTAASVSFVKPMRDHQFEKPGLKLVVDETFTPPLANATPLIQKVRSARPGILILLPTVISDAKLLLEKMNEFGLGHGKVPTIANGAAILGRTCATT